MNLDYYPTYDSTPGSRDGNPAPIPTLSAVLPNGTIVETVVSPKHGASLAVWTDGKGRYTRRLKTGRGTLVPYPATGPLLKGSLVQLPSAAEAYGSEEDLLTRLRGFVHRHVDLSPGFEAVASAYVLLTWVYDAFDAVPYLRFLGDYGTGKTRALQVLGTVCYKPILASGASTTSPLFRLLDEVQGTLVLDEADFAWTDERSEIVKILNNGHARGFLVLRSEVTKTREFVATGYQVYGPKMLATRRRFRDRALESRCLTEEMGTQPLRRDVPLALPTSFPAEAESLRNQLLYFRFSARDRMGALSFDPLLEPRLAQLLAPLLAVVPDGPTREELRQLGRAYERHLTQERGQSMEARVLEIIVEYMQEGREVSIQEIALSFQDRYGEEMARTVTPRWIGWIVRERLRLKPLRRGGVYVLPSSEHHKLGALCERYGLGSNAPSVQEAKPLDSPPGRVDGG